MDEMETALQEMMEYICDTICRHPRERKNRAELSIICESCVMEEFSEKIRIIHEGLTRCQECEYRVDDTDMCTGDFSWCRNDLGLDGNITKRDGCSRGKRKGAI